MISRIADSVCVARCFACVAGVLQYWKGESLWQGTWTPLEARLVKEHDRWQWRLNYRGRPTQKIRWVFSSVREPIVLTGLEARTHATWKTAAVLLQLQRTNSAGPVHVGIRNGFFLDAENHPSTSDIMWDTANPQSLKLLHSAGMLCQTDETVLMFRIGKSAFGVSVDDVLAHDGVFVSHVGLFVTRDPAPITLNGKPHSEFNAEKETISIAPTTGPIKIRVRFQASAKE